MKTGAMLRLHMKHYLRKHDKEVWRSNLEKYFNVKGFITWLALNTAIVNLTAMELQHITIICIMIRIRG
jgi:spore coat protein CotH